MKEAKELIKELSNTIWESEDELEQSKALDLLQQIAFNAVERLEQIESKVSWFKEDDVKSIKARKDW